MQNGQWEAAAGPTEYWGGPSFESIKLKADEKHLLKN